MQCGDDELISHVRYIFTMSEITSSECKDIFLQNRGSLRFSLTFSYAILKLSYNFVS